jgi:hypothetical protein
MHRLRSYIVGAALYSLLSGNALAKISAEEDADIQYLFDFVAASGCTFIRNGSDNNPEAAADHLRLKYGRGKRHVNSAEQFIDRLASESSWTGKKYTVNCNGEIRESGRWLHEALSEYRERPLP